MTEESILTESIRVCYACGSDTTYRNQWYSNIPIGWLCKRCNNNYILNPKWHPITMVQYICFKGRYIHLGYNPKIGVCNICRAVVPFDCKRTHRHHIIYHEDDVLRDTIEICPRCHNIEHNRNKEVGQL